MLAGDCAPTLDGLAAGRCICTTAPRTLAGTQLSRADRLVDLIKELRAGKAKDYDYADVINNLADVLKLTSICGLGQVVHKPIQSVLKYWKQEVEDHLHRSVCPANVCFARGNE